MNKFNAHFTSYFEKVSHTLQKIDMDSMNMAVEAMLRCYENGGTMFIFGNGGSGATASHVAGDFIKGISYGLEKRFKIICLNDNMPGLSAISNDLSYNEVFIEPLKNFLSDKDLVIGISGSGNSENVVKALQYAKDHNAETIAFCGFNGGKISKIADIQVHAPIADMEVTEDIHLVIFHAVKQQLMHHLKGSETSMGEKYDKRIEQ